jgi:dTDP-4-amino-4,6-dideoxygalactose transaminase
MNQMAAAVALAQVERQDFFISLRRESGIKYTEALRGSSLLTPQQIIGDNFNTFYTFSAKFASCSTLFTVLAD